jgi:hypothetical protein
MSVEVGLRTVAINRRNHFNAIQKLLFLYCSVGMCMLARPTMMKQLLYLNVILLDLAL